MVPWSKTTKHRITWFGYIIKLSSKTPARKALRIYASPPKKPSGKPIPTKKVG